jgi:hypothetical protein
VRPGVFAIVVPAKSDLIDKLEVVLFPSYSGRRFAAELKRSLLRIPAKANAVPEGSRTVFRAEAEHCRSVATLAF